MYVVQDIQTDAEYALKRLLGGDKQACNNIIREINIHKQVSSHPNVVRYVAASFIDRTNGGAQGIAEYLLVSELCKGWAFAYIKYFFSKINPIDCRWVAGRLFAQRHWSGDGAENNLPSGAGREALTLSKCTDFASRY